MRICLVKCNCLESTNCSGTNISCYNDLTIQDQNLRISNDIFIIGNTNIDESNLNLISSELYVEKNFTFSNSSLTLDTQSSISVDGCINVKNISITLSLADIASNQTKVILLNSSSNCLNATSCKISFSNTPKCKNIISSIDSNSLFLIISNQENCNNIESLPLLEIAVIIAGSVVGLAIIFVVLVCMVPGLRENIFPNEDRIIEVREKV